MKTTTLLTVLLCAGLFCSLNSYAYTYYWTGATNSNWNTVTNWSLSSCGGTVASSLPGTGDSVVFSGGCSNPCTINVSVSVLSLRTDATYANTISQGSGNTITVGYCKFASGTFSGSNVTITFSTSLIIEGGSFTTTSGTTTIKGNFSYTGGTFYPNGGRVVFYKTLTVSGVNSSSSISLYDVEFQAVAGNTTVTLSNIILNIADSTLLTGSNQLFINASQSTSVINAGGEVKDYNTSGTGGGTATIVVNGSSTQHITGNVTTEDVGKLPNLKINSTGTVYLIGYITMGGSTTLTYTGGTINAGSSKIILYYDNTITGAMTFNNLEFQGSGSTCVVSNTISVNGDVYTTLTGGLSINTGTINIYGSLSINNTSSSNSSATFNFEGTANDSIISNVSSGAGILGYVTINKTGGILYFIGTINVEYSWMNYSPSSYINPGTSTLNFFYAYNGYDIYIGGNYPTPVWNVTLNSYWNNDNYYYSIQSDSALSIRHTLTLAGSSTQDLDGHSLNILGNVDIVNTSPHISYYGGGSATLNFVGSANDSIISTVSLGEGLLGSIAINKTGGTLYLSGNISVANSWMNYTPSANINPGTSTLGFASITGSTVDIGGSYPTPVWNVNFGTISESYNSTYSFQLDSAFSVRHCLYIAGNTNQTFNGSSLDILGNINITNTSTDDGGTTIFNLSGSANDSIIAASGLTAGEGFLPAIHIDKTGGNLYLGGIISTASRWNNYSSIVNINPGTSTLFYLAGNIDSTGNYPITLWNIIFGTSSTYTTNINIDSAIIIHHNLTLTGSSAVTLSGHIIPIYGNIITSNTATGDGGSTVLYLTGSANDTIIASSGLVLGEGNLPYLQINKSGGALYLSGLITMSGSWTYVNGTVNAGTSTVVLGGTNTVTASRGSSYMAFNNLEIGGTAADITLASVLNIGSNLTINHILNTSSSNYQINVAGNWVNNGTYTGNNSNVTFNGSTTDSIKGSSNTTFYSLTLNKTGTLTLDDPTTVTNALTLTSGDIITSSTDLLTLNNGSSVSGANDNSFINGPVKKIGNSAFIFPTGGDNSYHPIGISAPSSTSDAFTAQYSYAAPGDRTSTDDSLTFVSSCDYWLLSHPAGSSNVTVSLGWGTNSCNIDRLSSLRVGYFNTSGSKWTDLGQSATTGSTISGSVTATTASSISTTADTFAISKHSPTPIVSAVSNVTICYGTSTNLSATASDGYSPYTYSWNPNTGLSSSTIYNPTASPTATTTYTVTVNDDDNAPIATATVVVTVDPQITINAGTNNKFYICSSDTLGGNPTTTGGTSPYTYSWISTPSGFTSSSANPVVNPTITTTYNLIVTDNAGCTSGGSTVITVDTAIVLNIPDTSDQYYAINGFTDTVLWFKFVTDSSYVKIWIPKDSAAAQISGLYLDSGSCSSFSVAQFLTTTPADSDSLNILSMYQGYLSPGHTYYIKITQPSGHITSTQMHYRANAYVCQGVADCNGGSCQKLGNPYFVPAPSVIYDSSLHQDEQVPFGWIGNIYVGNSSYTNLPDLVNCWSALVGTPQIFIEKSSTAPIQVENGYCALMGSQYLGSQYLLGIPTGYQHSEGIMACGLDITIGTTYLISYWRASGGSDIQNDVVLFNDLKGEFPRTSFNMSPPYYPPPSGQTIVEEPSVAPGWQNVVGCFRANDNYNELAIYATSNLLAYLYTTGVQIIPEPQDTSYLDLCNDTILIGTTCAFNQWSTGTSGEEGPYYRWYDPSGAQIYTDDDDIETNYPQIHEHLGGTYRCITDFYNNLSVQCGSSSNNPTGGSLEITVYYTINGPTTALSCSAGTNQTICYGASTELGASPTATGGTGPYTYSWTSDPAGFSSGSSNPTVYPIGTSTFVVTVTDANGCTCSSSVVITEDQDLSCYPGDNVTNSSCSDLVTLGGSPTALGGTGTGTYTYSWTSDPSGFTSSSSNPVVSPTVTTTYTVTVTDQDGCTCSSSMTVAVESCCDATEGDEITLSNPNSLGISTSSYFTNGSELDVTGASVAGDIVINGTWDINENTVINDCIIEFAKGASIYIEPGETLTVEYGSVLTDACDYMWNGITIEGNTANLILESNSSIQEALTAIDSYDGGVYTITGNGDVTGDPNTSLLKNYVGIYCGAYLGPHNGVITGAVISGADLAYLDGGPVYLDPPYSTEFSTIGIEVSNVNNISIGAIDGIQNFISAMCIGVKVIASNVNIYNNYFYNVAYHNPNWAITAVGVIDYGVGNPSVSSNLNIVDNQFNIADICIETFNLVQPYIVNNGFGNLRIGANIENSSNRAITFNNNSFYGFNVETNANPIYGVAIQNTNTNGLIEINNNNMYEAGYNPRFYSTSISYGIYLNNVQALYTPGASLKFHGLVENNSGPEVDPNIYGMFNFSNGIYINNSSGFQVYDNNIVAPRPDGTGITMTNGIETNNSANCWLLSNKIYTIQTPITNINGFWIGNNNNVGYTCNYTSSCGNGMQFNGSSTSTSITSNDFYNDNYGAVWEPAAVVGKQLSNGLPQYNKWHGTTTDDLYTYYNASAPSNTWYYTTGGNYNISEGSIGGSFWEILIQTASGGADECASLDAPPPPDSTEAFDSSGTPETTVFNIQYGHEVVMDSVPNMDSIPDSVYVAEVHWMAKKSLVSEMLTDTTWYADTLLAHFYDTVKYKNMGLIARLENNLLTDTLFDSTDLYTNKAANIALFDSISPTNTIEQNYQTVYDIYLNHILADTVPSLDSAQFASLAAVATQCPFDGGPAVFKARGMLDAAYIYPADSIYSFYYNDDSLCMVYLPELDRMKIKQSTGARSVVSSFVSVYPNPAKDQLTFAYRYAGTDNATLEIYNVLGEEVGEYIIKANKGQYILGLNDLSNGVYNYRLTTPCCEVGTGKFVVIK